MNPEFWLDNWKHNRIGFHQAEINPYLIAFWPQLHSPANSHVLVPLCGKSLDLLWLHQQGHTVIGVEISDTAIRQFFAENNVDYTCCQQDDFYRYEADHLTLLQGDFFKLTPQHVEHVTAVFDRASLVALPVELRQCYVNHLKTILPSTARILLVTFDYPQAEMAGPPFSVDEIEIRSLYQDRYVVEQVLQKNALTDYPAFQERGLTSLQETVYKLTPCDVSAT